MLKHLNTEKKKLDDIITCFSIFFLFFFICLAITTDDIARHWESSSKAWETAMTNQVMRHGVIHLRVTPTVLPHWHTHTHACSHTGTRAHAHTAILNTEEALWAEKEVKRKRSRLTRAQGWREQWHFILKCKCKMNYYCNLFLNVYDNKYACLSKPFQASLYMNSWRTPLCGRETSSPA